MLIGMAIMAIHGCESPQSVSAIAAADQPQSSKGEHAANVAPDPSPPALPPEVKAAQPVVGDPPKASPRPRLPRSPSRLYPVKYEGRHYYQPTPWVTCYPPGADSVPILTWQQHVEFKGGSLVVWGGLCNDAPQILTRSVARSRLRLGADESQITFQGAVLKQMTLPPNICGEGHLWCEAPPNKKEPIP
jgi:hypothetical protein